MTLCGHVGRCSYVSVMLYDVWSFKFYVLLSVSAAHYSRHIRGEINNTLKYSDIVLCGTVSILKKTLSIFI